MSVANNNRICTQALTGAGSSASLFPGCRRRWWWRRRWWRRIAVVLRVRWRARGRRARNRAARRGVQSPLIERIGGGPRRTLQHPPLVDQFSRDGLILVNSNEFPWIQDSRFAHFQQVPDFHLAFLIQYQSGGVFVS